MNRRLARLVVLIALGSALAYTASEASLPPEVEVQGAARAASLEAKVPASVPAADPAPAVAVEEDGADFTPALAVDLDASGGRLEAEPAAICRMRPQCDTDADCDGLCGAGLGDCARSKCPIRVCRCR